MLLAGGIQGAISNGQQQRNDSDATVLVSDAEFAFPVERSNRNGCFGLQAQPAVSRADLGSTVPQTGGRSDDASICVLL
jgi:hypothetical protein